MSCVLPELRLTKHAEARMRQRAIRGPDLELLLRCGSSVGDAITMTDDDIRREVADRKREIQRLERLRGVTAIVMSNAMVTVYRNGCGKRSKN